VCHLTQYAKWSSVENGLFLPAIKRKKGINILLSGIDLYNLTNLYI
jgi:hypothetical protein